MSNSTIMLSKPLDEDRLCGGKFVMMSEKLDGVPVVIYMDPSGAVVVAKSRQDKYIYSIQHILKVAFEYLKDHPDERIVGELYIPGVPFKDISGKVRSNSPQPDLRLYVYDLWIPGVDESFRDRYSKALVSFPYTDDSDVLIKCVSPLHQQVYHAGSAKFLLDHLNPDAEGVMVRLLDGPDSYYKTERSWGMQKLKRTNTEDFVVFSFNTAVSTNGTSLNMIGSIVAKQANLPECAVGMLYTISAGALTHAERTEIYNNKAAYIGRTFEAKSMPDPSYTGLREPRFVRWREDRD